MGGGKMSVSKLSTPKGRDNVFTRAEVAKHNSTTDMWVIVDGCVYNVTKWFPYHPGGPKPLVGLAGKDASIVFHAFHPEFAHKKLAAFKIGTVEAPKTNFIQEYKDLKAEMAKDGLFEWCPHQTIKSMMLAFVFFFASMACVFGTALDAYFAKFLGACLLGFFWQQLAFVGHDIGHNSVWSDRKTNYRIGIFFLEPFLGLSVGWWKDSHNTHHVVTNSITHDCDIQHLPFLSVTESLFGETWSTYHERLLKFDMFSKFLVSYQHILFYPIMFFGRVNLYVQGFTFLVLKSRAEHRLLEISCLTVFALWNALLLRSLDSFWVGLMFFLVSHGVSGLLHVQICLSHFTMDTYEDFEGHENDSDNFIQTQLATTMDVSCPRWMNWFHGGLQFQVEHHLFPRMPRSNLQKSQKYIHPFLKRHNIDFHAHDFIKANQLLIQHMKSVAIQARKFPGDVNYNDSAISGGLNLRG